MMFLRQLIVIGIFFVLLPSSLSFSADESTDNCTNRGKFLRHQGLYLEATPEYKKCVELITKEYGDSHINLTEPMFDLASLYMQTGKKDEAVELAEKAFNITIQQAGITHAKSDEARQKLAHHFYHGRGSTNKIEKMYLQSLKAKESQYGDGSVESTVDMIELGINYRHMDRKDESIKYITNALEIRKKILGHDHVLVANALTTLAIQNTAIGKGKEAHIQFKEALEILEKNYGAEHLDIAEIYYHQATLAATEVNNKGTRQSLLKKSLNLYEKILETDNNQRLIPENKQHLIPLTIMLIAQTYEGDKKYEEAESFYLKGKDISIKIMGPKNHMLVTLNAQLANLYKLKNELRKCVPLYEEEIEISEASYGTDSIQLISPLRSIIEIYRNSKMPKEAEKYEIREKEILAKDIKNVDTFRKNKLESMPELAKLESDLHKDSDILENTIKEKCESGKCNEALNDANKHIKQFFKEHGSPGKFDALFVAQKKVAISKIFIKYNGIDQAAVLLQEALETFQKEKSGLNVMASTPVLELAELYYKKNDLEKAEKYYKLLLKLAPKKDQKSISTPRGRLAIISWQLKKYGEAYSYFRDGANYSNEILQQVMGFAPARLQISFTNQLREETDDIISLISQHFTNDQKKIVESYNLVLRRKGLVLENMKSLQNIAFEDKGISSNQEKLKTLRKQQSDMFFSEKDPEAIVSLNAEIEKTEKEIIRASPEYSSRLNQANATSSKIFQSMPPNSALVEIYQCEVRDYLEKNNQNSFKGHNNYFAYILRSGSKKIEFVDLGSTDIIDKEIKVLRNTIETSTANNIFQLSDSSKKLYNLVVNPIGSFLSGVNTIYISPDGNLSLIPFEILQKSDDKYLVEDYSFKYITSGRDLLGFKRGSVNINKSLLIGDPDFNLTGKEKEKQKGSRGIILSKKESTNEQFILNEFKKIEFSRIPETRKEIKSIFDILGAKNAEMFAGKEAVEEILFSKKSPRFLHLATHGFFLKNLDTRNQNDWSRGTRSKEEMAKVYADALSKDEKAMQSSMLRSGIVLAGANNTIKSVQDTKPTGGIVTAEKMLNLNLKGTEMVVLSACDTGMGDVGVGEGVYGLRRAFIQAGAESLVMSMWSVPDLETREMMIQFYKNIESGKIDKSQALRQAILSEMKVVKGRYGSSNPKYWGAFIFLGGTESQNQNIDIANNSEIDDSQKLKSDDPKLGDYLANLDGSDGDEMRKAAMSLFNNYGESDYALTEVEKILLSKYNDSSSTWASIDALSYLCKMLGKSKQERFRTTLSVVAQNTASIKLTIYAKMSLSDLGNNQTQPVAPEQGASRR